MKRVIAAGAAIVLIMILLAGGCSPTPSPAPTSPASNLIIDVLGQKTVAPADSMGKITSQTEVSSEDGKVTLSIDRGIAIVDSKGTPLDSMSVSVSTTEFPTPPEAYIIGPVLEFDPDGAMATHTLNLTIEYDPAEIPEDADEADIYIASMIEGSWTQSPYRRLDADTNKITTQLDAFDPVAVVAPIPGSPASPPPPVPGIQVGNLAPDFKLTNMSEQTVSLSSFRGRPVLLNFWATWCPPCVAELPYLQQVFNDEKWMKARVAILAVNVQESQTAVSRFLKDYGYTFSVLLDSRGNAALMYKVRAFPTTFLIDKNGIIVHIRLGPFTNKADIENLFKKVI